MIIGVFELLADARSQVAAIDGYILALKDYWNAESDLEMALLGKPSISAMSTGTVSAETGGGGGH